MKKLTNFIDFKLLFFVLALSVIGILAISSATNVDIYGITREVKIQAISFGIGIIGMLIVAAIDYKYYGTFYILIYILGLIALLLVYVPGLGKVMYEARSWIHLGPIYFQTSEIVKLAYIITLAKVLDGKKNGLKKISDLYVPVLISLPYFMLIFMQPDFGTVLILFFIFAGMLFVAGLDFKIIAAALAAGFVSLPIVYKILNPYQRRRIDAFIYPDDPTQQAYFHRQMSKITIGSGRMYGSGLNKGAFSANNYLPVQESDFIFAVWVEETGFVGGAAIIVLYFLFVTRIISVAFQSKDNFGNYITMGVLFMFAFHIFENIGMTIGLMPITGVPLPFVSYGGSSMVINMLAIGLVMNVRFRKKLTEKSYDDL